MLVYLIYVGIGIIAGFFSGLLGISGGILTVPLLVTTFAKIGFPLDSAMHVAIGTSLAAMVFNSLSSSMAHMKRKNVIWPVILKLLPGIVLGVILGAFTAYLLADNVLEAIFAFFLLGLSVYFFIKKEPVPGDHKIPKAHHLGFMGLIIGYISNILGVGGGIFCVPLFTYFRIPFVKAVGSSVIAGLVISFLGALSYLSFGLEVHIPFPYVYGYIYLPAFLIISIVSFLVAPLGVKATHTFPQYYLRKIFAAMLLVMSGVVFFL